MSGIRKNTRITGETYSDDYLSELILKGKVVNVGQGWEFEDFSEAIIQEQLI